MTTKNYNPTRDVRIVCTVDVYASFGSSPTATTNDLIIPAFTPEHFKVQPGEKVAFLLLGATTGLARVTELTQ